MKTIVKWILVVLVVAACAAGWVYYQSLPLVVKVTEVVPKTAELYFTEQGTVVSQRAVDIYAANAGKIVSLNVQENQPIKEGDVLCVLDSTQLELQILQLDSNIKSYGAQISNLSIESNKQKDSLQISRDSLVSELKTLDVQEKGVNMTKEEQLRLQNIVIEQAELEVMRAEEYLTKIELLYTSGSVPEVDYTNAQKAVENASTVLEENRQQLQIIESSGGNSSPEYFQAMRDSIQVQINGIDRTLQNEYTRAMSEYYSALIEGLEASIEQLRKQIEDCTITATVSGVITSLPIEDMNMVSPQSPVASITTEGVNTIEVYVATNDIDQVTVGKTVELILKRRGGDKELTGKVTEIDNEATVKMSALGVEERRVKVTVTPDDSTEFNKGYDVDVKFTYYYQENQLTVPKTAIFKEDDQDTVWIVRNGLADKAVVTKGIELRSEIVIENGLASGDFVIVDADVENLKVGAAITGE